MARAVGDSTPDGSHLRTGGTAAVAHENPGRFGHPASARAAFSAAMVRVVRHRTRRRGPDLGVRSRATGGGRAHERAGPGAWVALGSCWAAHGQPPLGRLVLAAAAPLCPLPCAPGGRRFSEPVEHRYLVDLLHSREPTGLSDPAATDTGSRGVDRLGLR